MKQPLAIFLMGPTASGKTQLAFHLHAHLPVDVISVDASQVYRGMDIGTGKPTVDERARVPHRLIDIRDPAEPYSAAAFCVDARREMDEISARGRIPLLVGGTHFYFHALEAGLSALPPADEPVRARLREQGQQIGWPAMHARLKLLDAESAARIQANDSQRIQRALEIIELTGETPTTLAQRAAPVVLPYDIIRVALVPGDRALLHGRIEKRFRRMLELGLIDEVEKLRNRNLSPELPSVRTVGYRQVWEYLTGRLPYNQMVEQAIAATRQLAKRQLTWLRRPLYMESLSIFDCTEATEPSCLKLLHEAVATRDSA